MDIPQIPRSRATSPLNVLLIDDQPIVHEGYKRLLQRIDKSIRVHSSTSAKGGYLTYGDIHPQVVVLEMTLADGSGLEVMKRLLKRDPKAKVILSSAHESPIYIARAHELGAAGYLCKRSAVPKLVSAITSVAAGGTFFCKCAADDLASDEPMPLDRLSNREFDVFRLLAEGHRASEIAEFLNISPKTASVHQTRIMAKLGLSNLAQLARLAIRHDIISF